MSAGPSRRSAAERWLAEAEEELAAARLLLDSGSPPRIACFVAHLASEKAPKAVLIDAEGDAPRTHDLVGLLAVLPPAAARLFAADQLAELNVWAIRGRYPADAPEADASTGARMIELARRAVSGARAIVLGGLA